ncbi:MAG: tetratricopeptide repeat protein [Proteobacteria bacterium]|nr:tetratricopeptide repeat protein [Pseudomonadota bacterium]
MTVRRFSSSLYAQPLLAVSLAFALSACSARLPPPQPSGQDFSDSATIMHDAMVSQYDKTADPRYLVLLAEYHGRHGYIRRSLELYLQAAKLDAGTETIERGLELSLYVSDYESALELSERWQVLEPDSFSAHLSHLSNLILLDRHSQASVTLASLLASFTFDDVRYRSMRSRLFGLSDVSVEFIGQIAAAVTNEAAQNGWWHLLRAEAAVSADQLDKAAEYADAAVAALPEAETACLVRARIYFLAEQADEGNAFISRTLVAHPDFYSLYLMQARWLVSSLKEDEDLKKSDNLDRAIELVKLIREKRDSLGSIHGELYIQATHLLAFIYSSRDEPELSRPVLQDLSNHSAYAEFAHLSLAQLAISRKEFYQAESFLRRIYTREYLPVAQRLFVRVQIELKKWNEALESIEHYRLRGQDDDSALIALLLEGEVYIGMGDYRTAFDLYTAGLKKFSDNQDLMLSRSVAAHFLGKMGVIERDMRQILKDSPDNVSALNGLGYSLATLTSRFEEAGELLQRALELSPDSFAVQDSYGWLLFRQGDHKEAQVYLERAWAGFRDPEVASHLVELYWTTGLKDKAKKFLQKSQEEFPDSHMLEDVRQRLGL